MAPEMSVMCQAGLEQPAKMSARKRAAMRMAASISRWAGRRERHIIAGPRTTNMYVPDHFREDRTEVLHQAVRQIGFATLVTTDLDANHLPMLLEAKGERSVLRGHVARANPV